MAIARAEVQWASGTGLPRDVATQAFTFDVGSALLPLYTSALTGLLDDFYSQVQSPATVSIASFLRNGLVLPNVTVKWGTIDVMTGVVTPTTETSFTVAGMASVGDSLPAECAVRASVHGAITGVQAVDRRRRGGPFLGPGFIATAATIASGRVLVDPDLVAAVSACSSKLQTDAAIAGYLWVVYSRADQTTHEIVGGFVDNAWDTIKRRGTGPSARTTWSA